MNDTTQRLNKYLANLGICSRRDVKQLLKEQMVTVNGQRIREAGTRIDPDKDDIRLNGDKLKSPTLVYFLINKPKGIISTTSDEFQRKNVTSLIPTQERIYPIGRLDKDTTGLLLLTNDGELTNLLTHPRYHVDKVYRLLVAGTVNNAQLKALRNGVLLDDGITAPAKVTVEKVTNSRSHLTVTIHEGRNRQIRRMCETVGINLLELKRITFGPIALGQLPEGKYRTLSEKEIASLKEASTEKKTSLT